MAFIHKAAKNTLPSPLHLLKKAAHRLKLTECLNTIHNIQSQDNVLFLIEKTYTSHYKNINSYNNPR